MRSKTSASGEAANLLGRLYERGEGAVSQVLEDLLRNTKVKGGIGKTVGHAADAKRRVDRNMQFVLSLLNVPSRSDYNKLLTKIEALQGSLVNVNMKLDRLLAAEADRAAAQRRRAKPPRRPAGHKPSPPTAP